MDEKEFVETWVGRIRNELLKKFPEDFLGEIVTREVSFPGRILLLGQELFGTFEIIESNGNVHFQVQSLVEAKYYLYANRNKPMWVSVPTDEKDITSVVKAYELSIDQILMAIEKDYKSKFQGGKNFRQVSNQIFHALNLQRY